MCFLVCCSCDIVIKQRINLEDTLAIELAEIDWQSVDTYPTFGVCSAVLEKEDQEVCFLSVITQSIQKFVTQETSLSLHKGQQRVGVSIMVSADGLPRLKFDEAFVDQYPELQAIAEKSQNDLAGQELTPAIKRGLPVQISYAFELTLK